MAREQKPYRLYLGGRAKGPAPGRGIKARPAAKPTGRKDYRGPQPVRKPRRRWRRRILLTLVLVTSPRSSGRRSATSRSGAVSKKQTSGSTPAPVALTAQDGALLSNPSTILLLGADVGGARKGASARADAIVLVRTDSDERRIALLSIPRDLRVEIPGHGTDKINSAYAFGGPSLVIETVEGVTGLRVNHIAVVDFGTFGELIDALGGVTIDVPRPILSNRFDCPFGTQAECARWLGGRLIGERMSGGEFEERLRVMLRRYNVQLLKGAARGRPFLDERFSRHQRRMFEENVESLRSLGTRRGMSLRVWQGVFRLAERVAG